jgi:hypothetical protein
VVDLADQDAWVVHHVLEHASSQSALRQLVDRMPRQQVVSHEAPLHAGVQCGVGR